MAPAGDPTAPPAAQSLLAVALVVTIDGTAHAIPCSQVKRVAVDLWSHGFQAEVEFCTSPHRAADPLFAAFATPALIEVTLSLVNARLTGSATADPIAVAGIVTHKEWAEQTGEVTVSGRPVMHRRYTLRFADPARVLWRQHFPCELHVDKPLKDVIDAQKGAKITITYDWAAELDAERPLVFLPLGLPENAASFYDFVCWFAATRGGVLSYASKTKAYKLSAAKDATGTALPLEPTEVGPVRLEFPETPRASAVVLNSSIAIAAKTAATANASGVAGVRRDFLVRHPVAADVDARAALEEKRLAARGHEVVVPFALYPTRTVLPGTLVDFSHAGFGAAVFTAGKTYRIRELTVRASSADQDPSPEDAVAPRPFAAEVVARLELQAEAWAALPAFVAPRWPARVEGTIVSEQGDEPEETWQAYTDSATSLDRYKVKVPLYKASADVFVYAPFDPNGMPGHLYFPAYKGATVLLAFQLFSVLIEKFLDWRATGRLPQDGQGNHILVGKTPTNRTSLSHTYVEQKPVLLVARLNDKDTQTIELKDGTITIRTKEDA